MPNYEPDLSTTFSALGDPTRRGVLARLGQGAATVSELSQPYDMALPSFMQHLKVLEKSGLVHSHKAGRSRIYELQPERIREAEQWLQQQRQLWEQRLDRLDDYLLQMKEERE
ncbi:MAG: metalloregulator ArsR/SmtB family transcription factor [Natronospirillum sp.]|uniref:ArsR/SmtB family transcription factor n=1 Tax=Natronospirillum sp. TaxID=2812955 RepID=UPI0025E6864C|nr:metalloregulator ArsR/SmtB family transcription factor [Natronospirillum sp.]MCH8552898.1 metalloregulator ArsR/SmtB family transcription factor [Natronospirillum sp.]